jgi:hypothetical protein
MWKQMLFAIAVYTYAGSFSTFAADTTWYCSALTAKTDTKPTAFKFQVKGNELIDFELSWNAMFNNKLGETMTYIK